MKQRVQGIIIGAVIMFVLVGGYYLAESQAASKSVERWEYTGFKRSDFDKAIPEANRLGAEGWELVSYEGSGGGWAFKRRLP